MCSYWMCCCGMLGSNATSLQHCVVFLHLGTPRQLEGCVRWRGAWCGSHSCTLNNISDHISTHPESIASRATIVERTQLQKTALPVNILKNNTEHPKIPDQQGTELKLEQALQE